MRAGCCGKIPPLQALLKHKLLLSPCASRMFAAELTGALALQTLGYWYMLRVFCNASVRPHHPLKLSETPCRSHLFQQESTLTAKNSLHNPAKKRRKIQWASYPFLLLSWNTRAFPLISLWFFCLPFQWLSWESLQNTQKLRKRKIQCWRRKAEQQVNVSWNSSLFSKTTFLRTVWQERKHAFGLFRVIHSAIRTLGTSPCLIFKTCYFWR